MSGCDEGMFPRLVWAAMLAERIAHLPPSAPERAAVEQRMRTDAAYRQSIVDWLATWPEYEEDGDADVDA